MVARHHVVHYWYAVLEDDSLRGMGSVIFDFYDLPHHFDSSFFFSFFFSAAVQLISLDLEQSVGSVWFVRVACFNAIDLQRTNHTLPTDCSKSSEINCTLKEQVAAGGAFLLAH